VGLWSATFLRRALTARSARSATGNWTILREDLVSSCDDFVIDLLSRLEAHEGAAQIAEHFAVLCLTCHAHLSAHSAPLLLRDAQRPVSAAAEGRADARGLNLLLPTRQVR